MKYFTKEYIQFFTDLEKNNNKEWFDANRIKYDNHVKKPFVSFVNDLIAAINEEGGNLTVEAKDCISRINRDIRFSKDKTPYNLHLTAFISEKGNRDKSIPGFFIRITAKNIGMMVGAFSPSKEQLSNIRSYLKDSNGQFEKIIHAKPFLEKFGEIKGEIQKRIPSELKEAAENNFHISLKQLYFVSELESELILSDELLDTILQYYKISEPLNDLLTVAMVN